MTDFNKLEEVQYELWLDDEYIGQGKARTGLSGFHRSFHHAHYICPECGRAWAKILSHDEGAQHSCVESLCQNHGGGSIFLIRGYSTPISYPITPAAARWELSIYFDQPELYVHRSNDYNKNILDNLEYYNAKKKAL